MGYEIGHAIGLYHEHQRPDRDAYIQILEENIEAGKEHNFVRLDFMATETFGFGYDFASIMHYRPTTFSRENLLVESQEFLLGELRN